jgi:hypothetical protein
MNNQFLIRSSDLSEIQREEKLDSTTKRSAIILLIISMTKTFFIHCYYKSGCGELE